MKKLSLGLAAVALAACAEGPAATPPATGPVAAAPEARREPPVPVFNMSGRQIATVPAATVRSTPFGVPILVNNAGQNIIVTVGQPPAPGTVSAGRVARVRGEGGGGPTLDRAGEGRGDMSRPGTPVFVGTGGGGSPLFRLDE